MTTDDRDQIWIAQNGYPGISSTLVAFDPKSKKFVAEVPVGKTGAQHDPAHDVRQDDAARSGSAPIRARSARSRCRASRSFPDASTS
jgi:hypothetical protein